RAAGGRGATLAHGTHLGHEDPEHVARGPHPGRGGPGAQAPRAAGPDGHRLERQPGACLRAPREPRPGVLRGRGGSARGCGCARGGHAVALGDSAVARDIELAHAIILVEMVFFAWNRFPAAVVAVCTALALFFTGILTMPEAIAGFGDPVVILIAALLGMGAGLEIAGVGAWAGQILIGRTGDNENRRLVAIMVVAAVFSGLIGMNGAVAAMIPVVVIVAVRTGTAPSYLMVPLAFACLTGAKLTLLGTPVNVIAATQAQEAGVGSIGFLEWSVLGIPQLI